MKLHKMFLVTACAASAFVACQQAARASAWNERTILHVNNPIQIPGAVLTRGTYVVQLATPAINRDIVQFTNEDNEQVVATVMAVPDEARAVSGKPGFTFHEPVGNNPPSLRSWFYPGMQFGEEFVYPQREADPIQNASNRYVPAMSDSNMRAFPHANRE